MQTALLSTALHDQVAKFGVAGGNCKGSANHAAAASSKRAAIALLFCSSAKPLDGHAICSWWFCAEPDEVCILRGELAWLPHSAGTMLFLQTSAQHMTVAGS